VPVAAALQGATFAMIRAVADRGAAEGTRKLTGVWPGEDGQEQADEGRSPHAASLFSRTVHDARVRCHARIPAGARRQPHTVMTVFLRRRRGTAPRPLATEESVTSRSLACTRGIRDGCDC
jgi:hypothetical protein